MRENPRLPERGGGEGDIRGYSAFRAPGGSACPAPGVPAPGYASSASIAATTSAPSSTSLRRFIFTETMMDTPFSRWVMP